ncbi:MAG TPA: hypothetical protein VET65_02690 [Candidatus Limnocylindrales bacterium]|nr:hypothetical protein [Candidatus Limnocylindrales bacterium]
MTRAWTREGEGDTGGSVVDRFYQGILGLGDEAWRLIGRTYERQELSHGPQIEAARRAAQDELGPERFQTVFSAGAERSKDRAQGPAWRAAGDAAVGVTARRHLEPEQYQLLVRPLAVALPWLKSAKA